MRTTLVSAIVAAGMFGTAAASEDAKPSALIYSSWTKFCFNGTCFVGAGAEAPGGCGPRFAAVVIAPAGQPKQILRVTVPSSVNRADGVRVGIDQDEPAARPYARCDRGVCAAADIEGGAELVDRLKHGQMLVMTMADAAGLPVSVRLPLADFATAYDGPPQQPKMFEKQSGKLQEELKAQHQHGPRQDADRKDPCAGN
jgi:invasion protein IalB